MSDPSQDPSAPALPPPSLPSKDTDPSKETEPPKDTSKDTNVSWHRESCAEAVIDTRAALLTKTAAANPGSHAMKAVVVRADRLWANATTLTCTFMDKAPLSPFQANQQLKVRKAAVEWSQHANITFNFVEDLATATVRIAFDPNSGSWSFVGKEVSSITDHNQPTMNLGWIDGSNDILSSVETGVILHEFGHTLGLMHEHQSPLRGNKITLKEQAVIDFYTKTQNWSVADVKAQIIDVYNKDEVSNYSDVDLTSIMQYFMPPELNVQGIRVKPNNKLSEKDKAFMVINYPPFNEPQDGKFDPAKRYQFEAALDIVGVVGDQKGTILKHYEERNWGEVRYEFTSFCTEMCVARKAASVIPVAPTVSRDVSQTMVIPDGCVAEQDLVSGKGAAKGVATVDTDLWLPGDVITYSFVQGTGEATDYRKKRIRDTFAFYSARANIKFKEIPFDLKKLSANMHIYFGNIPMAGVAGWCKIGKTCIGYRQTQAMIDELGGTVASSFVISDLAVPAVAPTNENLIKQDTRTLYHEIGHALGLKHEHVSPNTLTTDTPDVDVSAATIFDDKSVMLYAGRKLRESPGFSKIKDHFDSESTKYNHIPSQLDIAFLGALYPNRKGHVDDKFEANMKDLGLTSSLTALASLRDAAFAVEGHDDFADKVRTYRQALKEKLVAVAPQRAVMQRARAPVPPSNFKVYRDAAVAPPSKATTGSFVDELVKTLQSFFQPTTGQIFALQFPGRFLQKDLYAWDTNTAGIYGQFVKPTVVNESEFRLVDQLYNVGTVVGAPNGMNLSIIYEQCLNNLVPGATQSAINFSKQQSQIRQWLMKGVTASGWVKDLISSQHSQGEKLASSLPGLARAARDAKASSAGGKSGAKAQFAVADRLSGDNQVNRMELSDALMQEYLSAKQAWEIERDEMIKNTKGEDMDALTRRLAHITATREAQLASKHADAVVRGFSHAVRQYLGFLDVKTPAEFLQDAKDALRESAVSSLDGSMKVYPVQMSPIDWFQSLSTSFTMEDLTVNAEVIAQQIDIKSKQLDVLHTRLAVIQSKPKTDIQALQDKLDLAQSAYDRAQADLATTYTSNVIALAKTFINADNKFELEPFKLEAKKSKIADAALDNIENGMQKLTAAQLSVNQNSRALTLLMSQKSLAEASDTTQEIIETNVQITALTKDIAELTTRLKTLRYSTPSTPQTPVADESKPNSVKDIDLHPPTSSSGGSRWQDLYMKHVVENKYTASSDSSKVGTSKTDCGLFFGSYHSESNETSSSSSSVTSAQSVEVEVGFRATMVTVDRGGWFQPQFFKQSAGFHSIDPNITWSKWPANIKTLRDLTSDGDKSFTELNKHLLPAYPVGFIVCKDITIRIHMNDTDIKAAGTEMEKYAASSAGVLCWSTSSNEHEKASDKSYGFVQKSDGCVIRIPGPQILGYMLQYTENDDSSPIPEKLPDDFLLSDADYDAAFNTQPARAVDPSTAAIPQPTPLPNSK